MLISKVISLKQGGVPLRKIEPLYYRKKSFTEGSNFILAHLRYKKKWPEHGIISHTLYFTLRDDRSFKVQELHFKGIITLRARERNVSEMDQSIIFSEMCLNLKRSSLPRYQGLSE